MTTCNVNTTFHYPVHEHFYHQQWWSFNNEDNSSHDPTQLAMSSNSPNRWNILSKTKQKKEALLAHLKKYTAVVAPQVAQIPQLLTNALHPSPSHSFSFKTVTTISTSSLFGPTSPFFSSSSDFSVWLLFSLHLLKRSNVIVCCRCYFPTQHPASNSSSLHPAVMLTHFADLCSLLSDPVPLLQGEEAGSPIDSKPEVFWPWTSVSVCVAFGCCRSCTHTLCLLNTTYPFFDCLSPEGMLLFFFHVMTSWILPSIIHGNCMNISTQEWTQKRLINRPFLFVLRVRSLEKLFLWKFILDFLSTVISSVALQWQTLSCFFFVNTCSHLWFFNSVPVWN